MNTVVDLSAKVTWLDGSPLVDEKTGKPTGESLGQAVAKYVLGMVTKGDPLKLNSWARSLFINESLTLDSSDFETLYQLVEKSETLNNFVKAPVLEALIAAKRATAFPSEKKAKKPALAEASEELKALAQV